MSKKENPKAFKHWINETLVDRMAQALAEADPQFSTETFRKVAVDLPALEMKARVLRLRDQLRSHLPQDYRKALRILLKSLKNETLKGFDLWPYTEFVQAYGLEFGPESLEALQVLTQRFTSEFAIRPFLAQDPKTCYAQLLEWSKHPNVHVRRWTSEGTRPRLPWGLRLHQAIQDPRPGLRILERLKHDPELYVRKSVANHLNDVAKDHPALVIETLRKWKKSWPQNRKKDYEFIERQALRTLIKKGDAAALRLVGTPSTIQVQCSQLKLNKTSFQVPDTLTMEFTLASKSRKAQKLVIDYRLHFQSARGNLSVKVFKLKTLVLEAAQTCKVQKSHSLKPITTRRYYSGRHRLEIQINGQILLGKDFLLKAHGK